MRELALNRPVHLAGRDAFYECALRSLQGDLMNYPVEDRLEKCKAIVALLQSAREHADFALRGVDSTREEKLFVSFLDLLLDSAQALQVMTKHEHLLASDRELLRELVGENLERTERSAAEHRQLACNLLKETNHLIQMAAETFRKLKEKNHGELARDESRARYQKAFDSFQRLRA